MKRELIIGKYTLESLTNGMYTSPLDMYREYIQNAVDSFDEALRVKIEFPASRSLISFDPKKNKNTATTISIGIPIFAYSKKLTVIDPLLNSSIVFFAIRFPGEPMIVTSAPIVAPITSRIHTKSKIPTHSNIGMIGRMKYPSVVMLEQLRTLDKRRIGYYIGKLPEEKMQDVTRALCVSLAIRQNTSKGM